MESLFESIEIQRDARQGVEHVDDPRALDGLQNLRDVPRDVRFRFLMKQDNHRRRMASTAWVGAEDRLENVSDGLAIG